MASLNPHAVEFSPYCSRHFYLFVNPNEIVHLYSFTGLTVTAGTPPYQYFTYHHNTNIALVGPAWFTHLPPSSLPSPLLHNNQQQQPVPVPVPVVGEEEKKSVHFRTMKKKFQGREKWREQENKKKKMLREKWGKEEEKKKSEEDLPPIKRGGKMTTVMIKNIPNQYTREMLLELLDEHCKEVNMRNRKDSSEYDFVYLPIDFKSSCNRGYAFVNFTHPDAAWKLNISWRNRNWPDFRSSKIRKITYAKLQGKEVLIKQFEDLVFPCDRQEYLPVCFDPPRNGSACQGSELCTVGVAAGLQSHSPISKRE